MHKKRKGCEWIFYKGRCIINEILVRVCDGQIRQLILEYKTKKLKQDLAKNDRTMVRRGCELQVV